MSATGSDAGEAEPRPRWLRPTIRLRLTALYAAVFLIAGVILLGVSYALVRKNLERTPEAARLGVARRLGLPAPPGRPELPGGAGGIERFPLPGVGGPPPILDGRPGAPPPGIGPFSGPSRQQLAQQRALIAKVRRGLANEALRRLLLQYLVVLGALTLASIGLGWLLAGRALRPLQNITAAAKRVSGETLDERINLQGPADELKELADTVDLMLGRLDAAFASQRRFVANASHELRTPLAVMRAEIDVTLTDPRATQQQLRAMGEAVREATERSERLIESLLTLARSEAEVSSSDVLDLAATAASLVNQQQWAIERRGLKPQLALGPAATRGDTRLLERLVGNLVENAVRHNVDGGWLRIETDTVEGRARLRVANGGETIEPAHAQTLVEPFRRATDRTGEGAGLGLSIVASVVRAHGGRLRLTAPIDGGLTVEVDLPAAHGSPPAPLRRSDDAAARPRLSGREAQPAHGSSPQRW